MSISLYLSSNTTDFTIRLDDPIMLNRNCDYEAALASLYTYNSCPNITDDNNKLRYSNDKGLTWKNIKLAIGAYELMEINSEIQRQMIGNDDYDKESNTFYINITINKPTSKSILEINHENYILDFNLEGSLASTLGFEIKRYSFGIHESPHVIDIEKVNAILVHCDFITGSLVNGTNSQVIHSFSPHVSPGYKIIEIPKPQLYFHPVVQQPKIDRVHIWITDQNNKIIDMRGEQITVCIQIRERDSSAKNIKEMKAAMEKYVGR